MDREKPCTNCNDLFPAEDVKKWHKDWDNQPDLCVKCGEQYRAYMKYIDDNNLHIAEPREIL